MGRLMGLTRLDHLATAWVVPARVDSSDSPSPPARKLTFSAEIKLKQQPTFNAVTEGLVQVQDTSRSGARAVIPGLTRIKGLKPAAIPIPVEHDAGNFKPGDRNTLNVGIMLRCKLQSINDRNLPVVKPPVVNLDVKPLVIVNKRGRP